MNISPSDLHSSFAEALASLPSQRKLSSVDRSPRRWFGKRSSEPESQPQTSEGPPSLSAAELLKIANIGKNDPVVRSYFASVAELAERGESTGSVDELYLCGLNDALDAYLRFDERRAKIERAVLKIGTLGSHQDERQRLERQFETIRDDVAQQVLRNALDQLDSRSATFDALRIDLERIEARKTMIGQQMAAVRELLIRDSLNTGQGVTRVAWPCSESLMTTSRRMCLSLRRRRRSTSFNPFVRSRRTVSAPTSTPNLEVWGFVGSCPGFFNP